MDSLDDFDLWALDMPAKTVVKCSRCDKAAVRGMTHFHVIAMSAEHCQTPQTELVCQDHYVIVMKIAKNRAEQDKPCWRCKFHPTDYYQIVLKDWLL